MTAQTANDYRELGSSNDGDAPPAAARAAPPAEGTPYGDEFGIQDVRRSGAGANAILMFVDSSHPVNLRGKLFDRFSNDRWYREPGKPRRHELQQGYYEPGEDRARAEVAQTIEVHADLDRSLYHSPGLTRLRFPGPMVHAREDGTLELPQRLRANTTYSVEASVDFSTGRYLVAEPSLGDPGRYLQLPADLSLRIGLLAARVTRGLADPLDKALALEEHLRTHYEYSFETVFASQGVTPLDWFLFEGKRGHCEFFATALVVMLRSVGVPARLATGYSLGEQNPLTGFYEVRVLDGHAWVEVHLPGRGWLMLEPTPLYPASCPVERNPVAEKVDRYLDRLVQTRQALDPGGAATAAVSHLRDLWRTFRHVQKRAWQAIVSLGWWLPAIAVLAFILALAARLGLLLSRDVAETGGVRALLRAAASDPSGAGVLSAAEALQRCLATRDAARPASATFREYYRALSAVRAELPPGLADGFDEVRYGRGAQRPPGGDIAAVSGFVQSELAARPYPRFSQQLRAWRDAALDLVPLRWHGSSSARSSG